MPRHAVTLIFNPLTLTFCSTSSVTRLNYVHNFSRIDQIMRGVGKMAE